MDGSGSGAGRPRLGMHCRLVLECAPPQLTGLLMTTPLQSYQNDLDQGLVRPDAAQARAVEALQSLYDAVLAAEERSAGIGSWLKSRLGLEKPAPIKGLYIYGVVGRGKTYLMDTFFECLPFERKLRTHFHRFMQ